MLYLEHHEDEEETAAFNELVSVLVKVTDTDANFLVSHLLAAALLCLAPGAPLPKARISSQRPRAFC